MGPYRKSAMSSKPTQQDLAKVLKSFKPIPWYSITFNAFAYKNIINIRSQRIRNLGHGLELDLISIKNTMHYITFEVAEMKKNTEELMQHLTTKDFDFSKAKNLNKVKQRILDLEDFINRI